MGSRKSHSDPRRRFLSRAVPTPPPEGALAHPWGQINRASEAVAFLLQDGYAIPDSGKGRGPSNPHSQAVPGTFPERSSLSLAPVTPDVSPFPSSKEGTGNGSQPTADDIEWWATAAREAGA